MHFYQQASYKTTVEDPSEKYMKLHMHFYQEAPYKTTVVVVGPTEKICEIIYQTKNALNFEL